MLTEPGREMRGVGRGIGGRGRAGVVLEVLWNMWRMVSCFRCVHLCVSVCICKCNYIGRDYST